MSDEKIINEIENILKNEKLHPETQLKVEELEKKHGRIENIDVWFKELDHENLEGLESTLQ